MARMKRAIVTGCVAVALATIGAAPAVADPASPENGCHGFYTTAAKEASGDRGIQGSAIGGRGNSDGDRAGALRGGSGRDAPGLPDRGLRDVAKGTGALRRRRAPRTPWLIRAGCDGTGDFSPCGRSIRQKASDREAAR